MLSLSDRKGAGFVDESSSSSSSTSSSSVADAEITGDKEDVGALADRKEDRGSEESRDIDDSRTPRADHLDSFPRDIGLRVSVERLASGVGMPRGIVMQCYRDYVTLISINGCFA